MKKKYGDYSKTKDILEKEYSKIDTKGDSYFGAVCMIEIKKVAQSWKVPRKDSAEVTILDEGYKWMTLYPKEEKFSIIAIFDLKLELVEFYFDIGKNVKYKPKVPYLEDLYLDVVITKENDVIFIDENELENAYKLADIKQKDYELAKKTADKIVNKFHSQAEFENLKQTSYMYLEKFMGMKLNG